MTSIVTVDPASDPPSRTQTHVHPSPDDAWKIASRPYWMDGPSAMSPEARSRTRKPSVTIATRPLTTTPSGLVIDGSGVATFGRIGTTVGVAD